MTRVARPALPIAVFVALAAAPATTTAAATSTDLLRCQKEFTKIGRLVSTLVAKSVHKCTEKAVRCNLAFEIDAESPTECLTAATTSCSGVPTKVAEKIAGIRTKALTKCGLIPTADVLAYIAGLGFDNVATECASLPPPLTPITVSSVPDLVDCVLAIARCIAEREVFLRDPRAQDSLMAIGMGASFPCVAP